MAMGLDSLEVAVDMGELALVEEEEVHHRLVLVVAYQYRLQLYNQQEHHKFKVLKLHRQVHK
jgi:hypothetical protein